jgi:hypothetical protein
MSGEIAEALRSNRAVTVSIVVAAAAVTACALVAIAVMLGWTPSRSASTGSTPAVVTNDSVALAPGETLVAPAETPKRPEPLMPTYSQPASPPPAPAEAPASALPPPSAPPPKAAPAQAAPQPRAPSYARAAPQRAPSTPASRSYCENCGRVSTITAYPGLWEVRVRFEDGSASTFRYRSPPPLRLGDRVRYEDDRLVPD